MRIRFTAPVIFETEGPRSGPSFAKDQVEDMRDDMARRWIRRGVAVEVPLELADVIVAGADQAVVEGGDPSIAGKDGGAPAAEAPAALRNGRRTT